jgi:hypothetical protein
MPARKKKPNLTEERKELEGFLAEFLQLKEEYSDDKPLVELYDLCIAITTTDLERIRKQLLN